MTLKYVDLVAGSDANDGSAATPKKTIDAAGTGLTGGDEVRVDGVLPTALGVNLTMTHNTNVFTLASALTQTISMCDSTTGWTAAANITRAIDATNKREGAASMKLTASGAFGTGQIVVLAIASTDYSTKTQVSFLFRSDQVWNAGDITLNAYTSADGTGVAANTAAIPVYPVINVWQKMTVEVGALPAAAQSWGLTAVAAFTSKNIWLDCINACYVASAANSLTIHSWIGTSIANEEGVGYAGKKWYPIQSINGTTVTVSNGVFTGVIGTTAVYQGPTYGGAGTAGYKYEPYRHTPTTATANRETVPVSGTSMQSRFKLSGGWERSDPDNPTQPADCMTIISGSNGQGYGLGEAAARHYVETSRIAVSEYNIGINVPTVGTKGRYIHDCLALNSASYGISTPTNYSHVIDSCFVAGTAIVGVYYSSEGYGGDGIKNSSSYGTGAGGYCMFGGGRHTNISCRGGAFNLGLAAAPASVSPRSLIYRYDTANSATTAIYQSSQSECEIVDLLTTNDAAIWASATAATTDPSLAGCAISGVNGDWTDHRYYCNRGTILTTGGTCVAAPTLALDIYTALSVPLPGVMVCLADTEVTVTARMKRSHADLTCGLKIPAYSIPGLTSDVVGAVTEAADTYEDVVFSFTPTETCGVVLWPFAYGTGTTHTLTIDSISAV